MKPNFSTWASKLRSKEGDEYGIVSVLPTLALAYNCVCKKSNNIFKKHGQRRAFDEINTIAFSARIDRHCDFKYVLSPLACAFSTLALELRKFGAFWH